MPQRTQAALEPSLFQSSASPRQPLAHGPSLGGPEEASASAARGLRRDQILSRLLTLRPGLSLEFLEGFSEHALREYLDRIESFAARKGRDARWTRSTRTPAIVTRPAASD